jgi:hypothetical protein
MYHSPTPCKKEKKSKIEHTSDNHPPHIHRNLRKDPKLTLCGVFDSTISEPISLAASGRCDTNLHRN